MRPTTLALLAAMMCAAAWALPKDVNEQYLAGRSRPGGWRAGQLASKLMVSRDDLELLDTINQSYEPAGGENATSMLLFDQLLALVQQTADLEVPTLIEHDDDGRAYEAYEEGDEPDYSDQAVPSDDVYALFGSVLDRDVVYVRQPHNRYAGIAQVVEALVAEAKQRADERDPRTTGVQVDLTTMRKANMHVVRATELLTLANTHERRRTLDVYFVHVRPQRSEYAKPGDAATGPWVISLLEHLPPVHDALELHMSVN